MTTASPSCFAPLIACPLSVTFAEAGVRVLGLDAVQSKVDLVNSGQSYIEDVPTETLTTAIPRSVRVSEAPSYGQTVITYHQASAGAQAYLAAAEEIARRGAK